MTKRRTHSKKQKVRRQRTAKPSPSQVTKAFHTSNASTNPHRPLPEGMKPGFYRTKSTINRLNMYRQKISDKKREQMRKQPTKPARIQPDRRWFGNTRVITQTKLETFREEMAKAQNDPFSVVLKRSKLPMSLLTESTKQKQMNLLSIEPYETTFGVKKTRKRPKLTQWDLEGLLKQAEINNSKYSEDKDNSLIREDTGIRDETSEYVFLKGTSNRIWQELYKVVDSSDIIIQVVDARDPMGTRCRRLEKSLKTDRPHKHMVILLNKCDLIPVWATARWVKILCREYPTLAFHASITNPFGKNALFQLLRQFAKLMKDRRHVSIGFIGYPNVGKSSVINTLRRKKVCKAAPIPGETRVWQYVSLTNRVYLIDCPGIVPIEPDTEDDCSKILKGVVRAEKVQTPEIFIDEILSRVKREYLLKKYKFPAEATWADSEEFLTLLAIKMGKLRKRGEPDLSVAARVVLYDWQRGRIPFFVCPPFGREGDEKETEKEGKSVEKEKTVVEPEEPEEKKKKEDAFDEETTNPKVETRCVMPVEQSFGELRCAMDFDDEDLARPDNSLEFEENVEEIKPPPGLMNQEEEEDEEEEDEEEEEEEKIGDDDDDEKIISVDNDDDDKEK